MMKQVQRQKINATVELLCKANHTKQQFLKQYIPVQEYLIMKLEKVSNLTIVTLNKFAQVIKEDKQADAQYLQTTSKSTLMKTDSFKLNDKKNPNQAFNQQQWNRNILRILETMSNSHASKVNSLKNYYKIIDNTFNEFTKQENKYKNDIKITFKEFNRLFQEIDSHQKQQNRIIAKIVKELKSKQIKNSVFFLVELKKIQIFFNKEINSYFERSKAILDFMKNLIKWEKGICKNIKELLTILVEKKKQIFKESSDGQKILGLITILEDNIQDTRELYLQKFLLDSEEIQKKMEELVSAEKSKVHHTMKFLNVSTEQLQKKMNTVIPYNALAASMCFKNFFGVSLAQGWIITSYTAAQAYLTFDNLLLIFDKQGNLCQKISSQSTRINKVLDNNVVLLEEKTKGFFRTGKQEYQLKFAESDRMEEFILFMENQIN